MVIHMTEVGEDWVSLAADGRKGFVITSWIEGVIDATTVGDLRAAMVEYRLQVASLRK